MSLVPEFELIQVSGWALGEAQSRAMTAVIQNRLADLDRLLRGRDAVAASKALLRRAARTMAGGGCIYEPWLETERDIERRRRLASIDGSIGRLIDPGSPRLPCRPG